MTERLLKTKLYIPRPNRVPRPRLVERLNAGLRQNGAFAHKLSLISAPAGFGKTTLASEWIAACRRLEPDVDVAWLLLDAGDNDPSRFWTYVVAALQTVDADVGAAALGLLQEPQPRPVELFLTALINEVVESAQAFILVLDDYHLIEHRSIDDALTFLIDHLPPAMHLVIASRSDPQLPLARLRARGKLAELRAADLRFTPEEAAAFLNQVMGLNLSADDVAALETRTEGWVAGLQMAALALQGDLSAHEGHSAGFIQAFTGSHRFVIDYLLEEVLRRQPQPVRSFLLQTALLDRLSGPLCDAVRLGADAALKASKPAKRCWRLWSAATCLSLRWTRSAIGIVITTCLPRSCAPGC